MAGWPKSGVGLAEAGWASGRRGVWMMGGTNVYWAALTVMKITTPMLSIVQATPQKTAHTCCWS